MEKFLGTKKELYLLCSHNFIIKTKGRIFSTEDSIFLFTNLAEEKLTILTVDMNELIIETTESRDYVDNLFTKLKVTKKDEDKLLALISIGFKIEEAIYSLFIQGKENELKWEKYSDYINDAR